MDSADHRRLKVIEMAEEIEAKLEELFKAPPDRTSTPENDYSPPEHDNLNAQIVKIFEGFTVEALLARQPKSPRERDLIGAALRNKVLKGETITIDQYNEMRWARGLNIPLRYKPEEPE